MYYVPVSSGKWHEHGVDVHLPEEGCRSVDGGWDVDLIGLANLTLMACLDIPFDVRL